MNMDVTDLEESPIVQHARSELERVGAFDEKGMYGGLLGKHVLELVKLFTQQGHSGASAAIAANMLDRLLRVQPLAQLNGEPAEWQEVEDGLLQNKRCGTVFKIIGGPAYDIDGLVFRDQNGSTFTHGRFRRLVVFPYTPGEPTIVDVLDMDSVSRAKLR